MTDEGLTAGAVARRLGVAVTTLRTWHQRYGLGPSGHEPGRHRRYTDEDLARLELMRRLTTAGVPPAEAASRAIAASARAAPPMSRPLRDGGGYSIPVGRAAPLARGLARAVLRMDGAGARELIMEAIRVGGVVGAWDGVVRPVLAGIGTRFSATGRLIEVEHLAAVAISSALASVPRPPSGTPVRILLACADEEQHTLALEALSAALAEAGLPSRMLGARVPPRALHEAIRRTGPGVVVLWSQTSATANLAQLRVVRDLPFRRGMLVAVGPGWSELPEQVLTARSLRQALTLVAEVAAPA
ncbi:MAG TPA: MerR family transcriptional regulator [Micromonosporaceae bacterium]